ncbi:bifunctional 4-hydroxy-2-oxoglutarate aldolase/2-dehydro-3-deoxy-phosphogluconate aldolase [Microbacterium sp. RD1]|uniref:bifunctional 4-hydroxy-2-oxoglutarate aldolase/2-dehydro-3-deoxy-phosphogluconate aldolase n=1 Tax=Microbacterium sp. RD1 TaxID=3457313 RepID=UPI003FA58EA2
MTDATTRIEELLGTDRTMAILRGMPPAHAVTLAHRAWDAGFTLVEVPIQAPEFVASLEAVTSAARERGKAVGAGTVIAAEQLDVLERLGIDFAVAPGLDPEIVALAAERDIAYLPGVATPSDIQLALSLGLTWLKAFPASVLGPGWLRAMAGPFPTARFVATGGIDASNAAEFLRAGARVVAVGSALEDPSQLELLRIRIAEVS